MIPPRCDASDRARGHFVHEARAAAPPAPRRWGGAVAVTLPQSKLRPRAALWLPYAAAQLSPVLWSHGLGHAAARRQALTASFALGARSAPPSESFSPQVPRSPEAALRSATASRRSLPAARAAAARRRDTVQRRRRALFGAPAVSCVNHARVHVHCQLWAAMRVAMRHP